MRLAQFRSFYVRHFPNDMEHLIDYFSVFGGLGWEIDIDAPLEELIVTHLLENYGHLSNEISIRTLGDPLYHRLLSAFALGDRRMHSAFRRSRISEAKGGQAVIFLRNAGILDVEYSREKPIPKAYPKQRLKREVRRHRISHKMHFTSPFYRFWFYFIAPMHAEIEKGNYEPVLERFKQRRNSFTGLIFEELSNLLLAYKSTDDPVIDTGSYWDRQVEIDILALKESGRIVVGECKWTNHKINKKELHKLEDKCDKILLQPDLTLLFSKRGFSNELRLLESDSLKLYSAEDFEVLLEGVSHDDLLEGIPLPS